MNERSKKQSLFLHVDGDSFFAECELTLRPELRGKPCVVGEDRGIAVAMTQEAKKLGVYRGMPVFKIKKFFPQVVLLSHTFGLYGVISDKLYSILISYLEDVERYSIDECFAVIRPSDIVYFKSARAFLEEIRAEVKETLGITYSFGVGRTKSLAKLASKLEKPDGLVVLLSKYEEEQALRKTSIDDVWGIGRRTIPRLQARGLKTAYDLLSFSDVELERHFSDPIAIIKKELSGIPHNGVHANEDPRGQKSIQSTATFRPSSQNMQVLWSEISGNVEYASKRARELGLLTKSISFFMKDVDFRYSTASVDIDLYTSDPGVLLNAIEPEFFRMIPSKNIRSTGVTLHNLIRCERVPHDLFGVQENSLERNVIESVADGLRKKFGRDAVRRVSSIKGSTHNRGSSFHG